MKVQDEILLEKYFQKQLNTDEEKQLDDQLQSDEVLRADFDFRKKVEKAVQSSEQRRMKSILQDEEKKIRKSFSVNWLQPKWMMSAAAAVLLSIMAIFYFSDEKNLDVGTVFAQNFSVFDPTNDRFLEKSTHWQGQTRGSSNLPAVPDAAFAAAMQPVLEAYTAKNYSTALQFLEKVPTSDSQQEACVQFYSGVCHAALGQFSEADVVLELASKHLIYQSPALWYWALSELAQGKNEAARTHLKAYLASPEGVPHRAAALKLLEKLK